MSSRGDSVGKHLEESLSRNIHSVNVSSVRFLPSLVVPNLGILVWSKSFRKMGHSMKNRSDNIIKVSV